MRALKIAVVLSVITMATYASVTGPRAGVAGAPGEGTCVDCHDEFESPNVGPGNVRLDAIPRIYEPGQRYTLAVTVEQQSLVRFGFQLTAIDENGGRIGTLEPLGPDLELNSQAGPGSRQYAQHNQAGTTTSTPGRKTWQVGWTAPPVDQGSVRFFVSGNAANGDGTNQGDYVYTVRRTAESPSSVVSLSFDSRFDGLALEPGSRQTIGWTATNPLRIESLEVRYSRNDGLTFPFSNLIFSTQDPGIQSVEWIVPNDLTAQARIRVQAVTRSGTAIEAVSGRFRIGGGPPPPVVTAARIEGKHLFVSGTGFQIGAVVEVSGVEVRTNNLEDASRELRCKKAGKQIRPGSIVLIVVKNPDGVTSTAFPFSRGS